MPCAVLLCCVVEITPYEIILCSILYQTLISEDIHHVIAEEKDRLILKGPNSFTILLCFNLLYE